MVILFFFFFFQAEDGIRDLIVTGVQTCALPICLRRLAARFGRSTRLRVDRTDGGAWPDRARPREARSSGGSDDARRDRYGRRGARAGEGAQERRRPRASGLTLVSARTQTSRARPLRIQAAVRCGTVGPAGGCRRRAHPGFSLAGAESP